MSVNKSSYGFTGLGLSDEQKLGKAAWKAMEIALALETVGPKPVQKWYTRLFKKVWRTK